MSQVRRRRSHAPSAKRVELAARHATTTYDRRRENFDRHAGHVVVAYMAGA
jgi:hypothetical protein